MRRLSSAALAGARGPSRGPRSPVAARLAAAIDASLAADPGDRPRVAALGAACELAAGLPPHERRLAEAAA